MGGPSLGARFSARISPRGTAARRLARRDHAEMRPVAQHNAVLSSHPLTVDIAPLNVPQILPPVPHRSVAFAMEGASFQFEFDSRLTSALQILLLQYLLRHMHVLHIEVYNTLQISRILIIIIAAPETLRRALNPAPPTREHHTHL
jgi:hypothetical protein